MRFSKWHALGNAYLLVERADLGRPLEAALVQRLCDGHRGVGSDGVVEVVAIDGASAGLAIWNPDGSRAEMSGNGVRIAARWLARRVGEAAVTLRIGERTIAAEAATDDDVRLDLGRVDVGEPETLDVAGEPVEVVPVSVGNPHAVVFGDGELDRLGPALEHHPRFPDGTNVQLVTVRDRGSIAIEIWERGVGPTLSSGSSSVAAAAAAVAGNLCESPVEVLVPGSGALTVELDADFAALLTGPVEEICRGELV